MKLSISLPDEDVEFLDEYCAEHGMASCSVAVHKEVHLLSASQLGPSYEDAWSEIRVVDLDPTRGDRGEQAPSSGDRR